MVLLYLDLLGVKARWRAEGRVGAEEAFRHLELFVRAGLAALPQVRAAQVQGGVESDAAALVFPRVSDAIEVARVAYQLAFQLPQASTDDRWWLRGLIVPWSDGSLRRSAALDPRFPALTVARHPDQLLDAIALEQSGVKGMRLLLDPAAIGERDRRRFYVWLTEDRPFRAIRRMDFCNHPPGRDDLLDVLWMIPDQVEEWPNQVRRISDRLRWSSHSAEELHHAAATFAIFDGCGAILHSMLRDIPEHEKVGRRLVPEARSQAIRVALQIGVAEASFLAFR